MITRPSSVAEHAARLHPSTRRWWYTGGPATVHSTNARSTRAGGGSAGAASAAILKPRRPRRCC
eukprot:3666702-Pyramimonas_sp.AAC.1